MIRIMTQKKLDRLLEQERAYGRRIAEKNQMVHDARIFRDRTCLTAETFEPGFEPGEPAGKNTEVVKALLKTRLMNNLKRQLDELIDYSTEEQELGVIHKARVYIFRVR